MSLSEILSIVTCVSSVLTLLVVTVAYVPQFKQFLVMIRDAVLWATLLVVIAATGWLAWTGFANRTASSEPPIKGQLESTASRPRPSFPISWKSPAGGWNDCAALMAWLGCFLE